MGQHAAIELRYGPILGGKDARSVMVDAESAITVAGEVLSEPSLRFVLTIAGTIVRRSDIPALPAVRTVSRVANAHETPPSSAILITRR